MIQYIKVTFTINDQQVCDMLMAKLTDAGYDGFEEAGEKVLAYVEEPKFDKEELQKIADTLGLDFETENVPMQNWNELWESNFPPVFVDDFCTIRAHFHDIEVTTPYDIQITPKMSFGTGHHATTQLMILLMKDIDLAGKKVLDFGTGTGVLAILAEMRGATEILAIDNDEWSVENAKENTERNSCKHITVKEASLEQISMDQADVILANINRHILLQYMGDLYKKLKNGGTILMSGLLTDDEEVVKTAAKDAGFVFKKMMERSNWIGLQFEKK
jgi:ribosomal protein L11 methyltransferase